MMKEEEEEIVTSTFDIPCSIFDIQAKRYDSYASITASNFRSGNSNPGRSGVEYVSFSETVFFDQRLPRQK